MLMENYAKKDIIVYLLKERHENYDLNAAGVVNEKKVYQRILIRPL